MVFLKNKFAGSIIVGFICLALSTASSWAAQSPELQFEQLSGLSSSQYNMSVHVPTGNVSFLSIKQGVKGAPSTAAVRGITAEEAARSFFFRYGQILGIQDHKIELNLVKQKSGVNGNQFVRFRQHKNGVPVFGGDLIVQVNSAMQAVTAVGKASSRQLQSTAPQLTAEAARQIAIGSVKKSYKTVPDLLSAAVPELWIYNPALLKKAINGEFLVWRTEVTSPSLSNPVRELVLVDALDGRILLHYNQIQDLKNRIIYDNNNNSDLGLPGNGPVRTEGGAATGINDVDKAYTYAGFTYDFYLNYHNRDSLDGAGMSLISTVRYCDPSYACPYQNAFWNGSQMVYGDSFANGLDVVGHEMTHAVTEHESNLFYYMQPGAMNESLSDIWGELIQQTYESIAPASRWLMGENLSIGAIRSMSNPPLFSDPDRMGSPYYNCGGADNGGVHSNSGVSNKAAFLMVDGGSFNGITTTGIGILKTAKIFYETQTNLLTEASDFPVLYNALLTACSNLLGTSGITSSDCQQVKNAVDAVQMNQQPASCPAVKAPQCSTGLPTFTFNDNFESGLGNWSHGALTGVDAWMLSDPSVWYSTYAVSGTKNAYADDYYVSNDSYIAMTSDVTVPANAWLHFNHAYDFEYDTFGYYDGGVVEYSVNGGAWVDAGGLFDSNGYTGTISVDYDNTIAGRSAFVGSGHGYGSSRLSLASFAGQNVRFRFRMATDFVGTSWGWWIDDVQIYTCNTCAGQPVNIGGTYNYYPTIQAGYNTAIEHQIILAQTADFGETLTLNNSASVMLRGGYNCNFTANAGFTTIHGRMTIGGGAVTVENIVIQ